MFSFDKMSMIITILDNLVLGNFTQRDMILDNFAFDNFTLCNLTLDNFSQYIPTFGYLVTA